MDGNGVKYKGQAKNGVGLAVMEIGERTVVGQDHGTRYPAGKFLLVRVGLANMTRADKVSVWGFDARLSWNDRTYVQNEDASWAMMRAKDAVQPLDIEQVARGTSINTWLVFDVPNEIDLSAARLQLEIDEIDMEVPLEPIIN